MWLNSIETVRMQSGLGDRGQARAITMSEVPASVASPSKVNHDRFESLFITSGVY